MRHEILHYGILSYIRTRIEFFRVIHAFIYVLSILACCIILCDLYCRYAHLLGKGASVIRLSTHLSCRITSQDKSMFSSGSHLLLFFSLTLLLSRASTSDLSHVMGKQILNPLLDNVRRLLQPFTWVLRLMELELLTPSKA
jgi:hypothetical protein